MFIKVFVPNANGKIELSVQELEALLKDAAAKAVSEKCANCSRSYYGSGITYLNTTPAYITESDKTNFDWTKVTCTASDADNTNTITATNANDIIYKTASSIK